MEILEYATDLKVSKGWSDAALQFLKNLASIAPVFTDQFLIK